MVDADALGKLYSVKAARSAALLVPNLPPEYRQLRETLDEQLIADRVLWLSHLEPWVEFAKESSEDALVARYNAYVAAGKINPNRRPTESK